ncbi:MAG: ornithine cyclodeaminase family protein [bacterium]|nr:ornithine cyclodeaminase family protein [bacterium]
MSVFSLNKKDIESITDFDEIIEIVERSFADYCAGSAVIPPVTNLDIPEKDGEIHIKSSHITGYDNYCIKIASGFYRNRDLGLPVGYGMMLLFSSETGFLNAVIFDEALLTDLRTAAAGAVAAKYLSRTEVRSAGVIGTGVQGGLQMRFLKHVRSFDRLYFWDIDPASAESYQEVMTGLMPGTQLINCKSPEEVVTNSEILVTCTTAQEPIVKSEWITRGMHITAMGSDGPDKQELDAKILVQSDKVVADHIPQCSRLGEIHHAISEEGFKQEDIHAELGDLILKKKPGRESDDEITVCDLTGVAVQDLAISNWSLNKAKDAGLGKEIDI